MHDKHLSGLVVIHSAPSALRQHIEWGLNSLLGTPQSIFWREQPLDVGTVRTHLEFRASLGTAAKIATALKNWHYLKFEVHEIGMNSGEMFRFTPDLGIHRGIIDAAGSVLISENILRKAISNFDDIAMRDELEVALGVSWDLELEPYRGVDLQEVQRLHAI
ncbi:MAG: DUF3145 family protein [Candidatus Planktophila sp.]|jgi:hypothetical protein|tara:strand:- start:260 stop:745 length:486 start_codon:yes stop_codon:yes gene_type:complete